VSGRNPTYTNAYVELIYIFYRLFGWGMRQTTGYMEEYWQLRGLDIAVPSFGQLSERFATLTVPVKHRCQRVAERLARGESIRLIVDTTGMKFGRANAWHRQKCGRDAGRTPWRKIHLSIDPGMNIHALQVTEDKVSGEAALNGAARVKVVVASVKQHEAVYLPCASSSRRLIRVQG
jgi:Transposase DDE domain